MRGVNGAATWELRRYEGGAALLLDFAGIGGMDEDIPLEESYGCQLRGVEDCGLYFRRINRSRRAWLGELKEFVLSLDGRAEAWPE